MNLTNLINNAKANSTNSTTNAANTQEELTMTNLTTNEVSFEETTELCAACQADMVEELGCTCNTSEEPTITNETTMEEPMLKLNTLINTNALSSTITATIFHELGCPKLAVLVGCALVDAVELSDNMGVPASFVPMTQSVMEHAKVQATLSQDGRRETVTVAMEYNWEEVLAALITTGHG